LGHCVDRFRLFIGHFGVWLGVILGHLREVLGLFGLYRGFFALFCAVLGGLGLMCSNIGAFPSRFGVALGNLGGFKSV
jgi:hypothetical protein